MWQITMTGIDTGRTFTYHIDAPEDTAEYHAYTAAAREHNNLMAADDVDEPVGPPMSAVWTAAPPA